MPAFTDYQIAAGHNNVAGLQKLALVVATSNIAFPDPAAQQNYNPGKTVMRLDLKTTKVGVKSQIWMMGVTWEQYRYMQTTYEGYVTIRTRWQNNAYANYNASLIVPTENLQFTLNGYANVPFLLMDLRAI